VAASPGASSHPILAGVQLPFHSEESLYKSRPLVEGAQPLLTGRAGTVPEEPIAWTFRRKDGGRTFATSLGGVEDFASESFQKLLRNGLLWAADRQAASTRPGSN
jgi:type 1 glutamine amidotransferase